MAEPFALQPALWAATAVLAVPTPPLEGAARADVCIVGAGYTGLSTALHLAEKGRRRRRRWMLTSRAGAVPGATAAR